MEFKIKPQHSNSYPLKGLLIKQASIWFWIKALNDMKFHPQEITIYPIPGNVANTIWGCLVTTTHPIDPHNVEKHELCQMVTPTLYIPERAGIHPPMIPAEMEQLFHRGIHIIHPEFGLVELPEPLDMKQFISKPEMHSYYVSRPEDTVFIPKQIKSFQVKPIRSEEILENLEKKHFPQKEKMKDESLNLWEKVKLAFYKLFFKTNKNKAPGSSERIDKSTLWTRVESFFNGFGDKGHTLGEKMQRDFEDLERRNQKEVDKLLDMLKNDPTEALKYAIPLDEHGSSRGGNQSLFTLSKRWFNFSLFDSSNGNSGSGYVDLGDSATTLRNQYHATAQKLIEEKEFHKAAFIYLKLLKNEYMAAITLEQGEFYQEAALLFLTSNHKQRAAECYEKGRMTEEAIAIYKDLNQHEKVGDLYLCINKRKEADVYFEKVVAAYKEKDQFVKAALIYRTKMNDAQRGQSMLLEGWKTNKDSLNCLTNYFENIPDTTLLRNEIHTIYRNDLGNNSRKHELFLQAIHPSYRYHPELSEWIREIAYEVIASQTATNPNIVMEMRLFNEKDTHLLKDTFRFRLGKKR